MTNEELAKEIALGIINTGVEGGYDNVCCSTAGEYPCMGVSSWEGIGGRGDALLSMIDSGEKFIGRTYSDIRDSGEIEELAELLNSDQGQAAQQNILAQDCLDLYVPVLNQVENLDDSRCFIYAGIWCPTSQNVVKIFLRNRQDNYDIRNLDKVRQIFRDQYCVAADVGSEYAEGYANRANNTFDYVSSLDLTTGYGVSEYRA
ncbi:hypothetical protein Ga0466249_002822 [Sporomusaceae bacterium BoRhaA]|uniref:hypothetical protein n=1 Tax=Pelorhabdus rhamnosifermentans TaxID=2772457 RepID=UPI001C0625FB|nr:hypothetical protein [Pelorhabdus rhamnosifermentans]MBU2701703.1 hypothetical protein [Pelorhabdus rhamnosifermentans]